MERINPHASLIESRMSLVACRETKISLIVSFANPIKVSSVLSIMFFVTREINVRQNCMFPNILPDSNCLGALNLARGIVLY